MQRELSVNMPYPPFATFTAPAISPNHPLLSANFFFNSLSRTKRHGIHANLQHSMTAYNLKLLTLTRGTSARGIASAETEDKADKKNSKFEALELSRTSRGEEFLEVASRRAREQAEKEHYKRVNDKEKLSRRKAKAAYIKAAKIYEPCCYGCGSPLQTLQPDSPGYVPPDTYELKRKHHQLKAILCGRCRLMTHGHMIPAVGGHGGHVQKNPFVSAEELRAQLAHIRHQNVLIIKLVDILDFSGSFLTRVRDLVGSNPIILVMTKVDLLPKGTDMKAIGDWVIAATSRKKLKVISIHLASAKSAIGISGVCGEIHLQRQGRDVYILGSANVGKSTFISALLKEMARRDYAAAAAQKYKPVQSAMPGTTVGIIPINAFSSGGNLIDTPGVHLHHRIQIAVEPKHLPLLAPRGRVRAQSLPSSRPQSINHVQLDLASNSGYSDQPDHHEKRSQFPEDHLASHGGLEGTTLFWGGVVRIDILKASQTVKLKFFGPNSLRIVSILTTEAEAFYLRELGKSLIPPPTKIDEGGKVLWSKHQVSLSFPAEKRPAGDIAISGLGWVTAHQDSSDDDASATEAKEIKILVHTPHAVQIFVRPSIPVGSDASMWYEYADLTEEQEHSLPKLYYYE